MCRNKEKKKHDKYENKQTFSQFRRIKNIISTDLYVERGKVKICI